MTIVPKRPKIKKKYNFQPQDRKFKNKAATKSKNFRPKGREFASTRGYISEHKESPFLTPLISQRFSMTPRPAIAAPATPRVQNRGGRLRGIMENKYQEASGEVIRVRIQPQVHEPVHT